MLQINQIYKQYKTGTLIQKALDGVSLNLRENEFVAILGPSGSGKTTLLNIIGGLDRYDSGDLIINGISTKKYRDRDWDSYRNHTIGFVFQSYNLIPHQSVLANVELALTISGISKGERRRRARRALEEVGLGAQLHKKPNQMSGGQMQRVAIARALVNDPDILLADEPTGALDSDTSVQVMELLKEVARERLVVMVTHNPELAEAYATRIVNLRDGKIQSDSDPFEIDESALGVPIHKNMGKSSMSFLTALSLSFNNLRTKKARTLLTSFAGSIGIIGIALILAISNGVNGYIRSMEEDTLSEYPLQINSTGLDLASMMLGAGNDSGKDSDGEIGVAAMVTNMFSKMDSNDLESLKRYFDEGESGIEDYTNSIEYTYNVAPQIFHVDGNRIRQVNPDRSFSSLGLGSSSSSNSLMAMTMSTDVFYEMPSNPDLYRGQYEVKAGRWPERYDECVLVLTSSGRISDFMLYTLGLRNADELDKMVEQFMAEEDVATPSDIRTYSYEEVLGISFKLVHSTDCYEYDEVYNIWKDKSEDKAYMRRLVEGGEDLTIVGIVQPAEGAAARMLSSGIGYLPSLTSCVIEAAAESRIVREQLRHTDTNVFTGQLFGETDAWNKFDLESIFEIDEEAMREAFGVNAEDFSFDMPDLSGMNFSMPDLSKAFDLSGSLPDLSKEFKIDSSKLDLSGMINTNKPNDSGNANGPVNVPEVDISELFQQLNVSLSLDGMQTLMQDLLKGYQESAANSPEMDYSKLQQHFAEYLAQPEVRQRFAEDLNGLMQSNMEVSVSYGQLLEAAGRLMSGYQEYVTSNNITGPGIESVLAYLSTPAVQQQITAEVENIVRNNVKINVTPEQLQELAVNDILNGYREYAAANALPDPARFGEYFLEYLQTPAGQERLVAGMEKVINVEEAEKQFTAVMQSYMRTVMASCADSVTQVIESRMTKVMEELSHQVSKHMERVMRETMRQIRTQMENALRQATGQLGANISGTMQQAIGQFGSDMESLLDIDPEAFADAIKMNMDEEDLTELLMSMMSSEGASYENNLKRLGYADLSKPGAIAIYPKDFACKSQILDILDAYNSQMEASGEEEKVITYTDMVGTLMSSVTEIVDVISYVLVAFVAISLVVSSIMIGVITYISVLERKKEIGILRAIGASRRNISQVFNAETFIIGFGAGLIGIGITLLLLIPGNELIHTLAGQSDINAALPVRAAVILIALSIILTLLGGLIPSRKAAKHDPVTALRTE